MELKDEMVNFLNEVFCEIDEFDIEASIYWYSHDYHSGQGSNLYRILCESKYQPGRLMRSHEDEGGLVSECYYALSRNNFGV